MLLLEVSVGCERRTGLFDQSAAVLVVASPFEPAEQLLDLLVILLTIPIFFPMVSGLDFGLPPEEAAIWFGILVLIVVEVGLITPPVGMNLFVIQSMAPDISIRDAYRGVWPFVASDLIRVTLLVIFPGITLFVLRL